MKSTSAVVTILFALVVATLADHYVEQFAGYKVVRAQITTQHQADKINNAGMDIWTDRSFAHLGRNDIRVNDTDLALLEGLGVTYEVMIDDLAATIEQDRLLSTGAKENWFDAYHTYPDIVTFASGLAKSYPKVATWTPSVGKSIEGRDIGLLTLSGGKNATAPKILLNGGQHAREWISPATVLYIGNKLATGYGSDAEITRFLDSFTIVIVPMMNPDGYTFTWASNRLWRKNRRVNSGGSYGVDLNRNWAFHWCESGASKEPSSDTYCGSGPASEPETKTLQDISVSHGPFKGAIDFHSYSQLIMRPYGWSNTPPPGNTKLTAVGDGMKAAMKKATGVEYTNQAIWQLYLSAGSSADFWIATANIPLSYGFEARDTGKYGFLLPPNQIAPSGEENLAAVMYLASQI